MAAGRHFKNTNRYNSAALQDILTKFGMEIDTVHPQQALSSNFTFDKIQNCGSHQNGGSRHYENSV